MIRRLLFLLLLLIWGCARPAPVSLSLYPGLAEELLASAVRSGESVHSLKSLAKVSYRDSSRSMTVSQALVVESPNRLRTEILGPFGASLLQLSSDGHQMFLNLPREQRFFSGPVDAAHLSLLTHIDVPLEQLVDILLYKVPLLEGAPEAVTLRGAEGYSVSIAKDGVRQELWFDAERRLVGSFWCRGASPTWQVEYGDFTPDGGFPREQRLEDLSNGVSLKVAMSSPELNATIRPELFRLTPPEGVAPEPFPDPSQLQSPNP